MRKTEVDPATAFLYAHGIRVSPTVLNEMVGDEVDRMRRTLNQPVSLDLTAAEVVALQRKEAPRSRGAQKPQ